MFEFFNQLFNIGFVETLRKFVAGPNKAEAARLKLLEAAVQIFGEKGLKGATLREIAAAAGQNVASIAYYFGGKEKLYRAVLEAIVAELRHHLTDVLAQVKRMKQEHPRSSAEALRLLKLFISTAYLRLLSRGEVLSLGRLVVREQTQPSAAFEILYDHAFREFHETLCFLVGTAIGVDPSARENVIRTHAVLGQMWFFVVGRETILRRLGWRSLESPNAELVVAIVCENLEVMLTALRQQAHTPLPARD